MGERIRQLSRRADTSVLEDRGAANIRRGGVKVDRREKRAPSALSPTGPQ